MPTNIGAFIMWIIRCCVQGVIFFGELVHIALICYFYCGFTFHSSMDLLGFLAGMKGKN